MDDFALLAQLADLADQLTMPVWVEGQMEVSLKSDGSPVTATDLAVETRLRARMAEVFPEDGFCGEEVGEHHGRSRRTWVVDGIDGTQAFTMGRPEWSTLISLVVQGRPVMGMVTSPGLGRRWFNAPSGDAQLLADGEESELSVSARTSLDGSQVVAWPPLGEVKPGFRPLADRLADLTGDRTTARPSWGSQVPNAAMLVAEGRVDAFVFFGGQVWDHAAPAAVVTAAGGRFSGLDGSRALSTGGGIYSNDRIHDELLDLILSTRNRQLRLQSHEEE